MRYAILLLLAAAGCTLFNSEEKLESAPNNAVLLFDGTDFSHWIHPDGSPVKWEIEGKAMRVVTGTDSIMTRESYQDFQLHVEFNVPELPPPVKGQSRGNRGNSGVYLQRRYEVQILDSFGLDSENYDCGALYRFKAPDRNMCKAPGEWQTYDITFHAPRWEGEGESLKKVTNARISVLQNGVMVHNHVELPDKTGAGRKEGPEPGPILLQDHGSAIMFRNIWIIAQ